MRQPTGQQSVDDGSPYEPPTDQRLEGDGPELQPPIGVIAAALAGLAAAALYTASNIALRQSVGIDPILVSAVKAMPIVVGLGPVLLWMYWSGRAIATSTRLIPKFVVSSLIAQFIGNVAFQISLENIGLAASVPITLGVLMISGAVFGRLILNEPVRLRSMVSMFVLMCAVVVLNLPGASEQVVAEQGDTGLPLWLGGIFAVASGVAYGFFGVVTREALTGGLSPAATMFISGAIGMVSLWAVVVLRMSGTELSGIAPEQWWVMTAAGVFNFLAFVALTASLKALPVVAVNLLNATQVAMAAVAGVMLFSEPITWPLLIGIALTFCGLLVLVNRKNPQ